VALYLAPGCLLDCARLLPDCIEEESFPVNHNLVIALEQRFRTGKVDDSHDLAQSESASSRVRFFSTVFRGVLVVTLELWFLTGLPSQGDFVRPDY
jgi:hypothetical protein